MDIKTVYRVTDKIENYPLFGIWCSTNQECRSMSMEDAFKNSKCIDKCIVNDSIKDYLIFTFVETMYDYKFFEIGFNRLIKDCEKVEMIIG